MLIGGYREHNALVLRTDVIASISRVESVVDAAALDPYIVARSCN